MKEKILIVGNGISAITAIKAIREVDKESEIQMFGEEKFYPYNRIRLSKGLLSNLEEDKILLQKKEWYKANNVDILLNTRVSSINCSKKEVILSNGNRMNYTKLLLANGAKNSIPPISGIKKEGVMTLRTLNDALAIMEEIKDDEIIINIGGGIQGLETAWILSKLGKRIVVAEISERLMPKELDERASKILERAIKEQGIEIMLGSQIEEIIGEKKAQGIRTKDGILKNCDAIIYSTGIKPNLDILKETPIETKLGVLVNNKMETNVSDIYAAGDVAEFDNHVLGLWNIAIAQGKTAGYNIVRKNKIYEYIVPVITLNAFNLSLFSMGNVDDEMATNIIVEDESEKNRYRKIYFKNNKIVGAIVIGNISSSPALKKAIEKEIQFDDINNVSVDELIDIIKKKK